MRKKNCLVLWAYARPEFTTLNIHRLSLYSDELDLVIVHDGLREGASTLEKISHSQTRNILTSSKLPKGCEVLVYDENVGLTQHFFRVSNLILRNYDGLINHEDDKLISFKGLQEITSLPKLRDVPMHADSRGNLKHVWKDSLWRNSLFSQNGVSFMNHSLIAAAQEEYSTGKVRLDKLKIALREWYSEMFSKKSHLERIVDKVSQQLSWGISNPDRPDSLLAYTLLLRGQTKFVTNYDFSFDISHLDFRGKNQEYRDGFEICDDPGLQESSFGQICRNCEITGVTNRVPIGLSRIKSGVFFAFDKVFGYRSGPNAQKRLQKLLETNKSSADILSDLEKISGIKLNSF